MILENGMKNNRNIKIVAASVTGSLHAHRKLACQDYSKHSRGKNFVAVVSDGAGSAKYGKIGAKIACETLCDLLKNADFSRINTSIYNGIRISREKLMLHRHNSAKSEANINDFAATIVGVVYHKNKGVFFHIGDGAAIAIKNDYNDFTASRPENGNFSCETYFYTQSDWENSLRLTFFDGAKTIFLMTDGLTNFSFSPDFQNIESGFIVPIDKFLSEAPCKTKALKALTNTLNAPKAQKINSDDKTLVWIKVR